MPMTGGKRAAVQRNQTERHMNQILVPIIAHFMNDLKPLCEMQVLVKCSQINALVKIVGFLAVKRRSDISGCIKRAAILTDNQAGGHIFIL